MKRLILAGMIVLAPALIRAQQTTETTTLNKTVYFKTSIDNLIYLYQHIDESEWRKLLTPLGYTELGLTERSAALHYVKGVYTAQYHIITFDDQFGVVAMTWSDASGKNSVLTDIRKALSKHPQQNTSVNTIYTLQKNSTTYTICLKTKKDGQRIQEEATIELGR